MVIKMETQGLNRVSPSDNSPKETQNYLLEWENLNYTIKTKNSKIPILKGVSGFAKSGEILAIMGSSGSGKTSLLSILANRIAVQPHLEVTGSVFLNKVEVKKLKDTHHVKYVLQEDALFATQTVRESLEFAAQLKVPHLSKELMKERVEEIILSLRLSKVADNIIGNSMKKGLSGGEKKRVSIGNELIAHPTVLILDEPTSGLDSFTAGLVIELLKRQTELGKTIIFTIHQPSTHIFKMFDRLILMSEGIFLYQGKSKRSMRWFKKIGYKVPDMINPPDFYMRLLYVNNRKNMTKEESEKLQIMDDYYKKNKKDELNDEEFTLHDIKTDMGIEGTNAFTQYRVILRRAILNVKRQKMLSAIKIVQAAFMAIIIILVYHNNNGDIKSVQNITALLFFTSINFISLAMQAQALTFPLERPVFIKEYKEGLYGVLPYFAAKVTSEFPFQLGFTILYVCIIYFVVPFNTYSASKFFIYFGIGILGMTSGNNLGYVVGSATNNVSFAITIGPLTMMAMLIYGGFFSNTSSFASAFYWVRYLSPFNFTYRALILNQFTDFDFDDGVYNPINVLNFEGEVWENTGALLLLTGGYLTLASIILKISGEYSKTHN